MKLRTNFSDYLGIGSAFLCLIHCLAAPVLLGVGSAFTSLSHHHSKEQGVLFYQEWDYLFLLLGLIAVYISSRHTYSQAIRTLLWSSFMFLAGAILLEEMAAIFQYFALFASLALIFSHIANLRQLLKKIPQTSVSCNS